MNTVQVISSAGTIAVALVAVLANVWTTRRTLGDRQEERLWASRAELYVEIIRLVLRHHDNDPEELLMTVDVLDNDERVSWQSARDREGGWEDQRARVWSYASDSTRDRYEEWDHAGLSLSGVVLPPHVTGMPRAEDMDVAIRDALARIASTGDRLIEQIRTELRSRQ